MIRINLLQVRARKERRRASGLAQVLVAVAVLAIGVGVIVVVDTSLSKKIDEGKAEIDQLQAGLAQQRNQITEVEPKRQELEQIKKKREMINDLLAGRFGPKFMLRELMKIVSKNGGPSKSEETKRLLTQQELGEGFNKLWDYNKLWLSSFEEVDREVTIQGTAMDVDDISEFQRRLNLSQYFDDVRWISSPEAGDPNEQGAVYSFTLKGRARYR